MATMSLSQVVRQRILLVCIFAIVLLQIAKSVAAPSAGQETADRTTRAKKLVSQMVKAYQSLPGYAGTIVAQGEHPCGMPYTVTIAYRRPKRALFTITRNWPDNHPRTTRLLYDGTALFFLSPHGSPQYIKQNIPPNQPWVVSATAALDIKFPLLLLLLAGKEGAPPNTKGFLEDLDSPGENSTAHIDLGQPGMWHDKWGEVETETVILHSYDPQHGVNTTALTLGKDDHLLRRVIQVQSGEVGLTYIESYSAIDDDPDLPDALFTPSHNFAASSVAQPAPVHLPSPQLRVGDKAALFAIRDLKEQWIRLDNYKGRVVLLDFWGLGCLPCMAQIPYLVTAYKKLHTQGLEIIGVNSGEFDTATATQILDFTRVHNMTWPQLHDKHRQLTHLYPMEPGIPRLILIGRDGRIVALDPAREKLAKVIGTALVANKTKARK